MINYSLVIISVYLWWPLVVQDFGRTPPGEQNVLQTYPPKAGAYEYQNEFLHVLICVYFGLVLHITMFHLQETATSRR